MLGCQLPNRATSCAWQTLHEAALGLRYLHEQNVVLGTLQWDNFWIGADNLTMVIPFAVDFFYHESRDASEEAKRWRAPELRCGEDPTPASDVFAFGKPIIEALTGSEASAEVDDSQDTEFESLASARVQQQLAEVKICMRMTQRKERICCSWLSTSSILLMKTHVQI